VNQDPFSGAAIMNHCRIQYYARQFAQANACLDRLAAEQPNYASGKYMHGIVYIALGRLQDATQIFEEIYGNDKRKGGAMLGFTYGLANRRVDAERVLNEMQEYQKQNYLPDQELGIIYLGLDDLDHALPLLRKAVEEKFPPAQALFYAPMFDRLRLDPRFATLAKEVRLPSRTDSSAVSNSGK
jgi:tetratricopeptide (TPR) repeat protein